MKIFLTIAHPFLSAGEDGQDDTEQQLAPLSGRRKSVEISCNVLAYMRASKGLFSILCISEH